jgi:hypothetical protein
MDMYDLDQLETARARLAELRPDPLRIPPNAATRAFDRGVEAFERSDWDALRDSCTPALHYDDRRRGVRLSGGVDMFVASLRLMGEWGAHASRTLLATAGERLALERVIWAIARDSEAEILSLCEVDAEGRVAAAIFFDPDDRRAASVEMSQRFRRGEGQRMPAAAGEAMDALLHHDFERLRATLPDDFVFHDQRRTGLGQLGGAAAFVESLGPLGELAPDFCMETLYTIAIGEYGMLDLARVFGTLAATGGAFESCYVRLGIWRGDRIVAMELFEPEDLDLARARFAALRPTSA